MSLLEFTPILETYSVTAPIIDRWLGQNASAGLGAAIKVKSRTERPRIMVYGVYNAGKSTLLNALLGSAQAVMADRPETAEIKGYDWRGYTLLDTPGIDAPIEHEKVTDDSLNKSDVVLFVVAAGGVAAEAATWKALVDILNRGRRVLLVINDKMSLVRDGEDYAVVINTARGHLQDAAERDGIEHVLDKVELCVVNARSALKGRIESKAALVRNSGLAELEMKLSAFLESCDFALVCRSAAKDVIDLTGQASMALETGAGDDASRLMEKLAQDIIRARERVISTARTRLDSIVTDARPRALAYFRSRSSDPEMSESPLQNIIDDMGEGLSIYMSARIVEELQVLDATAEHLAQTIDIKHTGAEPMGGEERSRNIFSEHVGELFSSLGSNVSKLSKEQATAALQSVLMHGKGFSKTWAGGFLKTLFHGKGEVALTKIAEKYGKFVGPAMTTAMAAVNVGLAFRQQQEEKRRAERVARVIADFADDFVANFKDGASLWISQNAEVAFAELTKGVRERQEAARQEASELNTDRAALKNARDALEKYLY